MSALSPGTEWLQVPLAGRQLIEASAGTGKTYTIVMLAVRALLETSIRIDELVITTFTRAAAQQLRTKLRARLDDATRILAALAAAKSSIGDDKSPAEQAVGARAHDVSNPAPAFEAYLSERAETLGLPEAQRRIRAALLSLELAAIDTLHALCARILRDEPLVAALSFEGEALDSQALARECLEDIWRAQILAPQAAVPLGAGVSSLLDCGFRAVARVLVPLVESGPVAFVPIADDFAVRRDALLDQLSAPAALAELTDLLADPGRSFALNPKYRGALEACVAGLARGERCKAIAKELCREAADNAQRRDSHDRKIGELPSICSLWELFDLDIGQARAQTAIALQSLTASARAELRRRARVRDGYTFADLVDAVSNALESADGDSLAARLRARWPLAMIDEFQDTDAQQYAICARIWSAADATLILIGDPKQSIYRFRGGDLHAYLAAAAELSGEPHRLGVNQRSSTAMVDAINAFYVEAGMDPFALRALSFVPVAASGRRDSSPLTGLDGSAYPPLRLHLAPGESWTRGELDAWCLDRCADDVSAALGSGVPHIGGQGLDPGHIAVLLPRHSDVAALRERLRARGVPCVGAGRASVLQSEASVALITLLRALLAPGDASLWRAALASPLFGATLAEFGRWRGDPEAWSRELVIATELGQRWRRQGIAALLGPLLAARGARMLGDPDGERWVTDFRHLLELLAAEEHLHAGNAAQLAALERAHCEASSSTADQRSLRIDSDSRRVKLLTVHASKGLEFDVVYLPLAWRLGLADSRTPNPELLALHDDAGLAIVDAGSEFFADHRIRARDEAHAEQRRLLYVALTRARHACHVFWGQTRTRGGDASSGALDAHLTQIAAHKGTEPTLGTWQELVAAHSQVMAIAPGPAVAARWRMPDSFSEAPLEPAPDRPARPTRWAIHSFTRIIRDAHSRSDPASALPAEDEMLDESQVPTVPAGGALNSADPAPDPESGVASARFREWRGRNFGNALHQSLERVDWQQPLAAQTEVLRAAMAANGVDPGAQVALHALAERALSTRMSALGSCLRDVRPADRLAELRFDFALRGARLARWPRLFAEHGCRDLLPTLPPLSPLEGLLTGAVDLVVRHEGRYFVADYKSDDLGDSVDAYASAGLSRAMQRGGYGLQLTLYQLALHRHLRARIANYDYARHNGGALYLFVRGLCDSGNGLFAARLPLPLLTALDEDCSGAHLSRTTTAVPTAVPIPASTST